MDKVVDLLIDAVRWIARRPKLTVRVLDDEVIDEGRGLKVEVENRSGIVTSLQPEIRCKYYYLSKLQIRKGRNRYFVREVDRHLEPFLPTLLTATPEHRSDYYGFSWFRTYTFRPTRGASTKVRIRNALLEPLGFLRFSAELLRFRLTGKVRPDPHSSIDDLERLRRSQGPH